MPGCEEGGPTPRAPDPRPDVVLVVIDTLRADHLGIYGYHRPTSPRLDALAAEGTWFLRAHAHSGWTLPSFASLLTGTLPSIHGVGRDAADPTRFGRLSPEATTLAEELSASGYATAAFVNNTFLAPEFGFHQGFGRYDYEGATPDTHRSARATVDEALAWTARQSAPVLLLIHFMEPHAAYDPPPDVLGTFTDPGAKVSARKILQLKRDKPPGRALQERLIGLYDEEILAADRGLGALVDGLSSLGRLNSAVLVVTSDHGEEFWDHGGFEHGHALWSELTRVPMIIHGAGRRGRVDALVDHRALHGWLRQHTGLVEGAPAPVLGRALPDPDAATLSENTLYGPGRVRLLTNTLALHLRLGASTSTEEVWRVDNLGVEYEKLNPRPEVRKRLHDRLRDLRGHLEAVDVDGPRLEDPEAFEQLRSLGYLQ